MRFSGRTEVGRCPDRVWRVFGGERTSVGRGAVHFCFSHAQRKVPSGVNGKLRCRPTRFPPRPSENSSSVNGKLRCRSPQFSPRPAAKLLQREREIGSPSDPISPTPIGKLLQRQREIEVPSTSISPTSSAKLLPTSTGNRVAVRPDFPHHSPKNTQPGACAGQSVFFFEREGSRGGKTFCFSQKEKGFPSPGVSPPTGCPPSRDRGRGWRGAARRLPPSGCRGGRSCSRGRWRCRRVG